MKKLITVIALVSTLFITNAQAVSYRGTPNTAYTHGYNNGYNIGYNNGKNDRSDDIMKVVGATFFIAVGVIIIYELAKPSENNPGQIQIARF